MAESLLIAATKVILSKLISIPEEEMKLVWGFDGELKRLTRRLETAQALISDAESRKVLKIASVQLWLRKLQDIALDADNVLDEFAFEALRRKLEIQNRMMNKVRYFFSPSNPLAFRIKMTHKVYNINLMLDEIYKEANEIGLRVLEVVKPSIELREVRQTHPYVEDSDVVGRDGDVSVLIDMVLRSDEDKLLPVISIIGMAGLGKTTLAKLVYKDEKVVRNFDERMWVCVSADINVQRLLNEMTQCITRTTSDISNIEAVVQKLREHLVGKRYLLVLDDMWNEDLEKWENMRNALVGIGGSSGSKIIVTTRSEVVASTVQTTCPHHILGLSDDDSWTVFKQKAFAEGGPEEAKTLVDVGRKIVKRCGGVPLAVKQLGGLMHSKKNGQDWFSIEQHEIWESPEKIKGVGILPSLRLSFDHLPSHALKQCFAYCSIFPKGFDIERNKLIEQWIAQGYIQPAMGSTRLMEDVGNSYFEILLWNSLLQDVVKDEYNTITSCKMHDLVHDFVLHISNNYRTTFKIDKVSGTSDIWHFKKLRTLFSTGYVPADISLYPRCLPIEVFYISSIEELQSSISKMVLLRYLDISRTNIRILPDFIINKLHHLQTLRMEECRELIELPKAFNSLVNLRHIYLDDREELRNSMPINLGQLSCLQTLSFFVVGPDKGQKMEELGFLSNLRGTVKVYGLEHVKTKEEAHKAKFSSNPHIRELMFCWTRMKANQTGMTEDEDVLAGLKPHSNLKGLIINGFRGGKVALWMIATDCNSVLYNLVKMELCYCNKLQQLPKLGHLPSLKILTINGMLSLKHIGTDFYGLYNLNGGSKERVIFQALRTLTLKNLPNLVEWSEVPPAVCWGSRGKVFPCLEQLNVERCPHLTMAPSHFPSIKKLSANGITGVALRKIGRRLKSLTSLDISAVSDAEINFVLEEMFKNSSSVLRHVSIGWCDGLVYLPNTLSDLASLESLNIKHCCNLRTMSNIEVRHNSFTRLREFHIDGCHKLRGLPEGVGNLPCLESLQILCCNSLADVIPSNIRQFTSLMKLSIEGCGCCNGLGLECLLSLTPGLQNLMIGSLDEDYNFFCPSITITAASSSSTTSDSDRSSGNATNMTKQLQQQHYLFVSLKDLNLQSWPKLKTLPDQIQHITTLTSLAIHNFNTLEALPDWLGNLLSLRLLTVRDCKNLKYLPSLGAMRRLTSLQLLHISECPILKKRCRGPEQDKISHIPLVDFF